MIKNKAKFIVIEGGDGAGKTTQSKLLERSISSAGLSSLFIREPGGTKAGEDIRNIMFTSEYNISIMSEVLILTASRHENIVNNIIPAFENKDFIICDRFILSTLVYQCFKDASITDKQIIDLHNTFNFGIYPDMTVVLNTNEDQSKDRINDPLRKNNKLDDFSRKNSSAIKASFLEKAKYDFLNSIIINSNEEVLDTHKLIVNAINEKFASNLTYCKEVIKDG